MSAHERTGWRDEWISRRHRLMYGWDCPGLDLDFPFIEYDHAIPCAVVDYKHWAATGSWSKDSPNLQALARLGVRSTTGGFVSIPALVAEYHHNDCEPDDLPSVAQVSFVVYPLNCAAEEFFYASTQRMSELEYVRRLYRIRHKALDREIESKLSSAVIDRVDTAPEVSGNKVIGNTHTVFEWGAP